MQSIANAKHTLAPKYSRFRFFVAAALNLNHKRILNYTLHCHVMYYTVIKR